MRVPLCLLTLLLLGTSSVCVDGGKRKQGKLDNYFAKKGKKQCSRRVSDESLEAVQPEPEHPNEITENGDESVAPRVSMSPEKSAGAASGSESDGSAGAAFDSARFDLQVALDEEDLPSAEEAMEELQLIELDGTLDGATLFETVNRTPVGAHNGDTSIDGACFLHGGWAEVGDRLGREIVVGGRAAPRGINFRTDDSPEFRAFVNHAMPYYARAWRDYVLLRPELYAFHLDDGLDAWVENIEQAAAGGGLFEEQDNGQWIIPRDLWADDRLAQGFAIYHRVNLDVFRVDPEGVGEVVHLHRDAENEDTIFLAHHADENGVGYHWDLNFHPDPHWTDYDELVGRREDNLWDPDDAVVVRLGEILRGDFGETDHLAGLIPMLPRHLLLRPEAIFRLAGHIVEPLIREIIRPGYHPNRIPRDVLEQIQRAVLAEPRLNPNRPGGLYLRAAAGSVGDFDRMANNAIQNAPRRGYLKMDSFLPDMVENNRGTSPHADCSMTYIGETSDGTCVDRWSSEDDPSRVDGAKAQWEFFQLVRRYSLSGLSSLAVFSIMVGIVEESNKRRSWTMEAFLAAIMAMAGGCRLLTADGSGLNDVNAGRPHFLKHMSLSMKAMISWLAMKSVNDAHSSLMSLCDVPQAIIGYVKYFWPQISKYLKLARMALMTVRNLLQWMGHRSWLKQTAGMTKEEKSARMSKVVSRRWEGTTAKERKAMHKSLVLKSCGGTTDEDYSNELRRRNTKHHNEKRDKETGSNGEKKRLFSTHRLCADDDGNPKEGHHIDVPINEPVPTTGRCKGIQRRCPKCKTNRHFTERWRFDELMANTCHVAGCRNQIDRGQPRGSLCGRGSLCQKHARSS